MLDDKPLNEKESLELITDMIARAKKNFHESGTSALLWGTVIAICGFTRFAEINWNFSIGFDIWYLTFAAVIPQLWIIAQERKRKVVKTHQQHATDVVWLVYAISIICLIIYTYVVPQVTDQYFADQHIQLLSKNMQSGETSEQKIFLPSFSSIFLIVYAFPTLATGLINRFKAMIWGGALAYVWFLISLFTIYKYDMLLTGIAGLVSWFIPGLILRSRYLKGKSC